ncbi:MAG TPA: hypothetical protein VGR21_00205, partial [Cryptosporangiaceae bacterium]|nr:hypothetical protein [Cryptosporangiaceae bacterium]
GGGWALLQLFQPGVCWTEATRSEVEAAEGVVVEVDMEPLAPCGAGAVLRPSNQGFSHAMASSGDGDHRVLQPGVDQSVPKDVDEANKQLLVVAGDDPSEAVAVDKGLPVPLGIGVDPGVERLSVQRVQLSILEPPRQS